jgi:hypothetical protein
MTTMNVKDAAGQTVAVEKPLAPGRAAATASRPVALSNEDNATIGALTETAPASDTASSGLNGRLQRIAQRLTSLIALLPASIGGKTAAASLGVTLASDDPAVATLGAKTDAKSTATDTTSISMVSVLKQISASCQAFVFGAGTAAAAERVTLASDDPAVSVLGATTGAAVITDANGTIQQFLRGLVKRWVDALGTGTAAAALRTTLATDVGLPAGTFLLGKVKTKFIVAAGAALTRPANTTAYTANDAISDNATAGSVTAKTISLSDVNDDTITIERLRLATTDTGLQGKSVRAFLYSSDPTASSGVQAGDNAAFSNKLAGFIGSMSGTFRAFSDGAVAVLVPDESSRIICAPGTGAKTVWWQLQALDAFTPSANSTTITPTAEGFQGAA